MRLPAPPAFPVLRAPSAPRLLLTAGTLAASLGCWGAAHAADPPAPPAPPASPSAAPATKGARATLPPFNAVHNAAAVELSIEIAPDPAELTLHGPPRFLRNLLVVVENGELVIRMKRELDVKDLGDGRIAIRMPQLQRYRLSGAGETQIRQLSGDRLEVRLTGAGSLEMDGEVNRLELMLSGVGSVEAKALVAKEADVRLSGVGSAEVHATERLDAVVSGVGSLTYFGNPKAVTNKVSGVGSVKRGG